MSALLGYGAALEDFVPRASVQPRVLLESSEGPPCRHARVRVMGGVRRGLHSPTAQSRVMTAGAAASWHTGVIESYTLLNEIISFEKDPQ